MKLGLALSGGGIRGVAHVGVLKALEDHKIPVDIIGGTSSGAVVASLYAMGYSPYYIHILLKRYAKDTIVIDSAPIISGIGNFMMNKKVYLAGLNSGEELENAINKVASRKGIQKMTDVKKLPLVIPTVDIGQSKEYIFTNCVPKENGDPSQYITDISIGKAVRASSSFPAVFSPCYFENHIFLDGGALDNIPVIEVKKQGATKVIAVNFKADDIDQTSNMMDIAMRTLDVMGDKISEESLEQSDFILTVGTDKTGLLDIEKMDSCYQYGYNAVVENLDCINKLLET